MLTNFCPDTIKEGLPCNARETVSVLISKGARIKTKKLMGTPVGSRLVDEHYYTLHMNTN